MGSDCALALRIGHQWRQQVAGVWAWCKDFASGQHLNIGVDILAAITAPVGLLTGETAILIRGVVPIIAVAMRFKPVM